MGTCLARNGRTVPFHRVLIVEPDSVLRLQLRNAVGNLAGVDADSGVPTARQRLLTTAHQLAGHERSAGRVQRAASGVSREDGAGAAKHSGVWRRVPTCSSHGKRSNSAPSTSRRKAIVRSLPAYLTTPLPASDRRDVAIRDRRLAFRGGRRSSDFERFRGVERPARRQRGSRATLQDPQCHASGEPRSLAARDVSRAQIRRGRQPFEGPHPPSSRQLLEVDLRLPA